MAGTGIGTFSDRLRDAVRGGGPFDDDPRIQGFGTGLSPIPTVRRPTATPAEQRARLLLYHDQIKVGLAGNLRDYPFVDRTGRDGHRRRGRLQRLPGRLRRRPVARRSPTSTPTTTRRCSTPAATSCRTARRWPTGCG